MTNRLRYIRRKLAVILAEMKKTGTTRAFFNGYPISGLLEPVFTFTLMLVAITLLPQKVR